MDSTPPLSQSPKITEPLLASASKLPIKRKTPDDPFISAADADTDGGGDTGSDPKPPPFKFHRIWTEPDEIRFLQGLVDGSSENLFFPRDLNVFYTRFSNTMSQPYTKSQLSEKLRRLRKKFRVTSSRLGKGLDMSLLSPHDRALYDLSKQLWHPDYADTSPFNADKSKKSNLVGVKVSFLPTIPYVSDPDQDGIIPYQDKVSIDRATGNDSTRDGVSVNEENIEVEQADNENNDGNGEFDDGDGMLSEVNVELDRGDVWEKRVEFSCFNGPVQVGVGFGNGDIAAKVVMDVFDECLKDFRNGVVGERSNLGGFLKEASLDKFEERWREQRVAELDVLARRMRLVLEHSLQSQ
ncbi:hypothetical protein HAX54_007850 [Datura stramonium]|uniref:Glabrous enhancer-binding protein-like DBD domain-containing protein n=1 Tax=Datura stramonium TaxID=4076 RepID=A0ABS8RV68_DATST|nr:hypothetical protein [Datura stramonium]